jgi:hypothetical protein
LPYAYNDHALYIRHIDGDLGRLAFEGALHIARCPRPQALEHGRHVWLIAMPCVSKDAVEHRFTGKSHLVMPPNLSKELTSPSQHQI